MANCVLRFRKTAPVLDKTTTFTTSLCSTVLDKTITFTTSSLCSTVAVHLDIVRPGVILSLAYLFCIEVSHHMHLIRTSELIKQAVSVLHISERRVETSTPALHQSMRMIITPRHSVVVVIYA